MKYFTIFELVKTNTGLPNSPGIVEMSNLVALINNVLDPARELLKMSISVSSGYRSKEVNAKVGGVANSQHLTGEAADITCFDNQKLFNIIKNSLEFDQLINEKKLTWIHVSFSLIHNRNQIIVIE